MNQVILDVSRWRNSFFWGNQRKAWDLSQDFEWPEPQVPSLSQQQTTLRSRSFLSQVDYRQEFNRPWIFYVILISTLISSYSYPLPDFLNPDAASKNFFLTF